MEIEVFEIVKENQSADEVYEMDNKELEIEVGKLLIKNKFTIATAESCTGGLLAGRFINYPGISSVFLEGAVTYSNESKMRRLGVKKETLEAHGAVSVETAGEMARGIAQSAGTDIGISVTGIAGPDGGTQEKPVGLVYIGMYIRGKLEVKKFNFTGDRQSIRNTTVFHALSWLEKELIYKE